MTSNQIAPTDSQTIKSDIRFYELLLCSCIAPNQPFPKIVWSVVAATAFGGIWSLLGGGLVATTLFGISLFMGVMVIVALNRSYRTNQLTFQRLTTTISPAGVTQRVEHSNSEARYEWSRVASVQRAAGVVLLTMDSQTPAWVCVPTRCFSNAEDSRQFARLCHDYWREGQVKRHELGHVRKARKPMRPVTVGALVLSVALIATLVWTISSSTTTWQSFALLVETLALFAIVGKLDNGRAALSQANTALLQENPKKALQICTQALKKNPDNGRLHMFAGYAAYTLGNFDNGLAFCRAAVAADPDDALAHAGLAFGLREQGFLDEALAEIDKAIAMEPNIPWAYVIKANALSDLGRYDEALEQCDRAEKIEGNSFSPVNCRAAIHCCRYELDRALELVIKAQELCEAGKRAKKEKAAVLGMKALIHSRRREFDKARATVDEALAIDPENPVTLGIRASVYLRSGDMEGAAKALAAARASTLPVRTSYVWYSDNAIHKFLEGHVDEALESADAGIATARRAMPLAVKATILVRQGKHAEALPLLDEAIQQDAYFMLAYDTRAAVYEALGEADKAKADRERVAASGFESFF